MFVGPRESYDITAHPRTPDGAGHGGQLRGLRGLRYAAEDIARAVECGIRSFLIADLGLLALVNELQRGGELPSSVVWKVSVMLAPSNPLALRELERVGASTVNVPSDMTVDTLRQMRAATTLPIDLYVESPDGLGGVVRGDELGDLVRAGAPLYAKFGLRNSRMIYPSGLHLVNEACAIAREKVHRAAAALEWVSRLSPGLVQSTPGRGRALGVPQPGNGRVDRMSPTKGGTVRRIISACAALAALAALAGAAFAAGGEPRQRHADALAQLRHRGERRRDEEPGRGVREAEPEHQDQRRQPARRQLLPAAAGGVDRPHRTRSLGSVDGALRHASTRSSCST